MRQCRAFAAFHAAGICRAQPALSFLPPESLRRRFLFNYRFWKHLDMAQKDKAQWMPAAYRSGFGVNRMKEVIQH
jgi:hypothetical protein